MATRWAASSSNSGRFDWAQGGRFPSLTEPEPAYHGLRFYENFGDFAFTTKARAVALRDFGPTLSPMNAFLTLTGIETLLVRMERHVENARKVAEFLAGHPRVAWVSYAGLEGRAPITTSRGNTCRRAPARSSPSGSRAATRPASSSSRACSCFSHLANIGDTRSLILHPASTTHRQLSDEQRVAAGAGPDVDPPVDRPRDRRGPDPRPRPGARRRRAVIAESRFPENSI